MVVLHILSLHFHQHALVHFSHVFNIETLPKFYVVCPLIPAAGKELHSLHVRSLPFFLTKHSGDNGDLDFHLQQHLFIHTFWTW